MLFLWLEEYPPPLIVVVVDDDDLDALVSFFLSYTNKYHTKASHHVLLIYEYQIEEFFEEEEKKEGKFCQEFRRYKLDRVHSSNTIQLLFVYTHSTEYLYIISTSSSRLTLYRHVTVIHMKTMITIVTR